MSARIDPRPLYQPVNGNGNGTSSINDPLTPTDSTVTNGTALTHLPTESHNAVPITLPSDEDEEFKQYPTRWVVLFVFSSLTITNAILWICFAPIQDLAADFYGVDDNWINGLSITFMALYFPGYFLAFWAMDKYGFRTGLCIAAVLQTIGAWIRWFSVLGAHDNQAHHPTGFIICLIGQCLAAISQPMFTNAPAKMSSDWFSVKQRNLATTIGAMSNPIGIAVGQLLPSNLVDKNGGIPLLLLISACICTGTCLMCFLFVKRAPPTPPSRSTMERYQAKALRTTPTSFWEGPLIQELKELLTNKQFLILMFGVGMGLGLFNAVTTLIEQLVKPSGYDKDDAGNFGALLIGCGLLGAGIVGPIMDATHAYNRMLKLGLLSAMSGTIFMLMALRPGHFALVAVSFGVLGLVMLPLLPVCMECAAECTYPASEDASSGLMLGCGNVVGIIMIIAVGALIPDKYSTVFNPASIVLLSFLVVAVVVVGLTYNGPLKRQAAEKARNDLVPNTLEQSLLRSEQSWNGKQ